MNETHEPQDKLTAALQQALEAQPAVNVPSDFTARMMARIPQQSTPRRRIADAVITTPGYGRKSIFAALGVLLILMLVTAALPSSDTSHIFQLVLFLQAGIYALWLCFGKRYLRS